jgi:hypothetical protein
MAYGKENSFAEELSRISRGEYCKEHKRLLDKDIGLCISCLNKEPAWNPFRRRRNSKSYILGDLFWWIVLLAGIFGIMQGFFSE